MLYMEQEKRDILRKAYELGFKFEQQYGGCTQCALAAVFEALGIKVNNDVFKAGTGFAGGGGLIGYGTCGALIGGAMVISYLYPRTYDNFNDPERVRWKTYRLVKELIDRFISEYRSCICVDIQKKVFGRSFNLWDPKEFQEFEKLGGHVDKCPDVVGKAAMWTVDIILRAKEILEE